MLAHETVEEVRRLLAQTPLSQRQIARLVHVSRGTVHAIARGKRRDRPDCLQCKMLPHPRGPLRRCRSCGARVRVPCLACSVRGAAARCRENPGGEAPNRR